ncbi:BnaC06g00420D [Brassica napus]|uniref:BnaC06g00420D protein n=1 Tax=Brassica napus TaxID=3708 RepID=A0A078FVJ7_BRANA|nr:BnaC06g00420D [Brassica napus]
MKCMILVTSSGSRSNMNFKNNNNNMGNEPPGDGSGGAALTRQGSIYSLTFDEFQSSLGKDFGSMNMDELLKNIWTAEETQAMAVAASTSGVIPLAGGGQEGLPLQRQGSLTLPRTLSTKTVDQVWKDLSKDGGGGTNLTQSQRQQTLGEVTLEEFLVRAGVVREEAQIAAKDANTGFSVQASPQVVPGLMGNLGAETSLNMGLVQGVVGAAVSPVTPVSADGIGKNNGDSSSLSPSPYMFNGGVRGRKSGTVEKVVERRQRRMIKNRESAARSRARKQAYTVELEAEVAKLKEENEELQRKQAKIMEMQKNQEMEMMNIQGGAKKRLRRTESGPW